MKISRSIYTVVILALIVSFSIRTEAQQRTDERPPLIARVMGLMSQAPPDAFPPLPEHQLKPVRKGLFSHSRPVFEIAAPNGEKAAGTSEGALYIRELGGDVVNSIAKPQGNSRWDVEGGLWAPDSKLISVRMIDDTEVPQIPIINWLGKNEEVSMMRYSRAGEEIQRHQLYIVNTETGESTSIKHGTSDPYFHLLDWNRESSVLYYLSADRLTRRLSLFSADVKTGEVKLKFSETNSSGAMWWNMLQGYDLQMASQKMVTILGDGSFIWTSEKSGFAHLYLHDSNGRLVSSLTDGKKAGFVDRLVEIDEKNGFIYAIMQGADKGSPYDQMLYRFSLNDKTALKLTDGPVIMLAFLSDDKKKLTVHRSGLPSTLEIESVNTDGTDKRIIWNPDLSFLKSYGFAPEIIEATAADGKTTLRSLILKPAGFDPEKTYPVLEWIYGGPNTTVIENVLPDPQILQLQDLADNGFIIVLTDGRGTPGRGREFQDHSNGKFGQVEIADHAAVLRQLGKIHKYMDMNRVGIFGHSWGGYFTLRALLQEPDLYKAGVLMSPVGNTSTMRVAVESYMGCLPSGCPEAYKAGDSVNEISKLKAPVLIIHGTADDDIPVSESDKIVDALQKAGKEHQFVMLPGVDHIVQRSPITLQKTTEFFLGVFNKTGARTSLSARTQRVRNGR